MPDVPRAEAEALSEGLDRRLVAGLSLIGLAATEAVEDRSETAVQIAAAAEVYAHQEGIVNVYSDETPGHEFVDQARAALSPDDVARATEAGRRLTIKEALELSSIRT